MEKGNATAHKIFGEGSFFSPLLFGKFFDPSDAFPLWEFESDVLLSNNHPRSSKQTIVDWSQTDTDYVLKAELPGETREGEREREYLNNSSDVFSFSFFVFRLN